MEIKNDTENLQGGLQNEKWSVIDFLFSDSKLTLAALFLFLNIFLVSILLIISGVTALNICESSSGGWLIFSLECDSFLLGWYEVLIILIGVGFFYVVFGSVYVLFIPEIIFIFVYFYAFILLTRKKEKVSSSVYVYKEKQLRVLKWLKVSLILTPILVIIIIFVFFDAHEKGRQKMYEGLHSRIEQRYKEIIKNKPDLCPDAPEGFYLDVEAVQTTNTKQKFWDKVAVLKPSYWKGVGVAYLSRENSWDGLAKDSEFRQVQNPAYRLIDFSSSTSIVFGSFADGERYQSTGLGEFRKGSKYDLHVFILNDTVYSNGRFTFDGWSFTDKNPNTAYGSFTIRTPSLVTAQPCLTLEVK
jgi:hypothetical protein